MIIATRTLTIIAKSGETKPVEIRIFAPFDERGLWRCRYEIDFPEDGWPAETRKAEAQGHDSLAALQFAIQMIGVDIHTVSYHREGKMYWHEQGAGYGIIVPKDARDLLSGDDAKFYGDNNN